MPKKKSDSFDDPFDFDLPAEDIGDLDSLLPLSSPVPAALAPPRATASEIVFRSMRNNADGDRPLQGNYQYVNLLLPVTVANRIQRMANAHKMMLQPFMRWMVDQMALLYEEGHRPDSWRDDEKDKKRVPALVAPVMVDLLKSWAQENRMKFQPFMRWLTSEFVDVSRERGIQPQEPEQFVPDEAALFHWASLTVEKYSGTGKRKDLS